MLNLLSACLLTETLQAKLKVNLAKLREYGLEKTQEKCVGTLSKILKADCGIAKKHVPSQYFFVCEIRSFTILGCSCFVEVQIDAFTSSNLEEQFLDEQAA
jgi:hypothetical protein